MTLTERYLTAAYMGRRFYRGQTVPGANTIDEGTAQFIIDETADAFNDAYGTTSDITDINNTARNICGSMMARWKNGADEAFELTEKEIYKVQDVFSRIPMRIHDQDDYTINENQ